MKTDLVWKPFSVSTESTKVPTDTKKQSTSSTETGDYISGSADKNEGIHKPVIINQSSYSRKKNQEFIH
jgi:hypothetical protein